MGNAASNSKNDFYHQRKNKNNHKSLYRRSVSSLTSFFNLRKEKHKQRLEAERLKAESNIASLSVFEPEERFLDISPHECASVVDEPPEPILLSNAVPLFRSEVSSANSSPTHTESTMASSSPEAPMRYKQLNLDIQQQQCTPCGTKATPRDRSLSLEPAEMARILAQSNLTPQENRTDLTERRNLPPRYPTPRERSIEVLPPCLSSSFRPPPPLFVGGVPEKTPLVATPIVVPISPQPHDVNQLMVGSRGRSCSDSAFMVNKPAIVEELAYTRSRARGLLASIRKALDRKGEEGSLAACRVFRECDESASFAEKYELLDNKVLGTGLSGAVRMAIRKSDNEKVAVKTLCTTGLLPDKIEEIMTEIEIFTQLDHPNICRLLEVYEDVIDDERPSFHQNSIQTQSLAYPCPPLRLPTSTEDTAEDSQVDSVIYLVMELCSGKELFERLAKRVRYDEASAKNIVRQMVDAIQYCHERRICHRDLKLENFVFKDRSESSPVKLIDFGLSKIFNPGETMASAAGTVYYVAPEVLRGAHDLKCDMWSIGVMTYMLLSGLPPFGGKTDREILRKIAIGEVDFSSSPVWESVSNEAIDFICNLLIRNANRRMSAEEALAHPWLLTTPSPAN